MMISKGWELWGTSLRFWQVWAAYTLSRTVKCLERSGLPVALLPRANLRNDLNGAQRLNGLNDLIGFFPVH